VENILEKKLSLTASHDTKREYGCQGNRSKNPGDAVGIFLGEKEFMFFVR
jgi:hypothetical protein